MTIASGETGDWRAVVDLERLARWMDGQGLGDGPIDDVAPLGGGTQNIMLRFSRSGRGYVFRRPPRHPRPESDAVMRREMRVLQTLAGGPAPHPAFIAGSSDPEPMGAAFYLMAPVDGFNATVALPPPHAGDPDLRRQMGEALVDGAVALASIDIEATGLGDLSRLDNWLERQTPRWRRQLDGYSQFSGWDGPEGLPGVETIAAWLVAHQPAAIRPGLVHGDYHLANVLYRHDGPSLAAIVDWELVGLGDPLLDLGWLMATWPDGEGEPILTVTPWDGFPTLGEIVDRYLAATGRSADDARWFGVMARFKLAILLEGSHARAQAGLAPLEIGARLHRNACSLLLGALRVIQT